MKYEHLKTWRASTIATKLGCDLATARKIKAGELTLEDWQVDSKTEDDENIQRSVNDGE